MSTFTLADAFDATDPRHPTDLKAPLPLGYSDAVRRATDLRAGRLPYPAIARVMAEYHGYRCSPDWWRATLRTRGVAPRPRGVPFGGAA